MGGGSHERHHFVGTSGDLLTGTVTCVLPEIGINDVLDAGLRVVEGLSELVCTPTAAAHSKVLRMTLSSERDALRKGLSGNHTYLQTLPLPPGPVDRSCQRSSSSRPTDS